MFSLSLEPMPKSGVSTMYSPFLWVTSPLLSETFADPSAVQVAVSPSSLKLTFRSLTLLAPGVLKASSVHESSSGISELVVISTLRLYVSSERTTMSMEPLKLTELSSAAGAACPGAPTSARGVDRARAARAVNTEKGLGMRRVMADVMPTQ